MNAANANVAPNKAGKVPASIDAVRSVAAHGPVKLVWPHAETSAERRPVLLDSLTAGAIIACYDAMNADNQAKFARMIAHSKGRFVRVVDFCWRYVKVG